MFVDVESNLAQWRDIYRLCISFINPRPIALVSSLGPEGQHNLAPFSFYNMVCANPPVVFLGLGLHRDRRAKDTLINLRARGEFAVATVTADIADKMVRCAAELPYGRSEWDFSGLTPKPATKIAPPLVSESPINIECRARQIVTFDETGSGGSVVFGDILAIHIADRLIGPDGAVDPHKLRTVGRLGGKWYCNVTEPYELEIPEPG